MQGLISEPSYGAAFAFGRDNLVRALREHWSIYVIIALSGALLTAAGASPTHFRTAALDGLATFPALAFATRAALPGFGLTGTMVLRLIGLYVLIALSAGAVIAIVYFGSRYLPPLIFLFLGAIFIGVWLAVKWSLTSALYTLQSGRNISVFTALRDSSDIVTGDLWWTILGLNFGIGLICMLLPGIVSLIVYWSFAAYSFPASFAAALVYYAGSIPGYVWIQLSLTAVASSTRPVANLEASPA